ncbi:MAG: helix-turn-helix domain-containing protein [Eubacterium sp.]|nr:helix-turn-helix domain-containing protein [Eubacterium sp.]
MDAKVELDKKLTLSVEEASELSGIGIHTIYRMMKNPKYDFVLWIGKKRRIKRVEFEKTIRNPKQIVL